MLYTNMAAEVTVRSRENDLLAPNSSPNGGSQQTTLARVLLFSSCLRHSSKKTKKWPGKMETKVVGSVEIYFRWRRNMVSQGWKIPSEWELLLSRNLMGSFSFSLEIDHTLFVAS